MKSMVSQGLVFVADVKKFEESTLCMFLLTLISHNCECSRRPTSQKVKKKQT